MHRCQRVFCIIYYSLFSVFNISETPYIQNGKHKTIIHHNNRCILRCCKRNDVSAKPAAYAQDIM